MNIDGTNFCVSNGKIEYISVLNDRTIKSYKVLHKFIWSKEGIYSTSDYWMIFSD